MAIKYAVATGNWSNTATWNGGTLPTSSDDVYSNTFTVTIDVTATVITIKNISASGVTAGGTFKFANGANLTCTSQLNPAADNAEYSMNLITFDGASGVSATLNANIKGTGNIGTNALIVHSGAGTLNVAGTIIEGNINSGTAVKVTGSGTLNISGYVAPTAGTQSGVIANTYSGSVNITGAVNGGNSGSVASVLNSSTGTVSITGSVLGGSSASAINNASTGSLVHSGTATATNNVPAITSSNTGATVILSGPFICSANGTHAVYCPNWKWANTSPPATYYEIRSANLSVIRPLYTADSVGGNPATSNVRSGTVYGPSNELTGTVAMPTAQSVSYGVPVDNTIGSAVLKATDIWNYAISGITTSGSIGERLKNAATVSQVSSAISNALR